VQSSRLKIDLLGGFRVSVGDTAVGADVWRRRKPAALVKILALTPGHCVHREQLMEPLWPDLDAAPAGANLRKAIYQARGALDGVSQGAGRLIEFVGDVVSLTVVGLTVDVQSFRSSLDAARRAGDADRYRRALDVFGGELLPDDPYEEWTSGPRRELREEYLAALAEMSEVLEAAGALTSATEAVRLVVAVDPTREESHVALMRLYALAGRRGDALRQYDYLVEVLDNELGIEPGVKVQRLREQISARRGEEPRFSAALWEQVGDLRVLAGDGAGAFQHALDAGTRSEDATRIERKCAEGWLMQH
jgi:DNA-binding SARP family transcriptional activator